MPDNEKDHLTKMNNSLIRVEEILKQVKETAEKTEVKVSEINERTIEHGAAIKSAHKRIDTHDDHIEDYKRTKNKALGFMFGGGFLSGGAGAMFAKFFSGAG